MTIRDLDRGVEMFRDVLDEVMEQVTAGKGEERHGHGTKLLDQPWRRLGRTHGVGFLTGQAAKKLEEAVTMKGRGFTAMQVERELLGSIAYIAFSMMMQRELDGEQADREQAEALGDFPELPVPAELISPQLVDQAAGLRRMVEEAGGQFPFATRQADYGMGARIEPPPTYMGHGLVDEELGAC